MVICRKAVAEFKARKLRDCRKAKRFTDAALDTKLERADLRLHTDPRKAQKVCLLLGMQIKRFQFLLGLGGGKALEDNEPVLMADDTWKPIKRVQVGDMVKGHDGKPHVVQAVYPQGKQRIVKITFAGGSWSLATWDHLWPVRDINHRRTVLTTRELQQRIKKIRRKGLETEVTVPHMHYAPPTEYAKLGHERVRGAHVRRIEEVGTGPATCLSVEGEHFVTRDYLVTHNTKLTLDLFVNRVESREASRCLVLVPNIVNLSAWCREVTKHAPHLRVAPVIASGTAARQAIFENEDLDIVVSTYAGFVERISKKRKPSKDGTKTKSVKEADLAACKRMRKLFDFAIFDETTAYSNPSSLTFRALRHFSKELPFLYGLTGTPFDKKPERLWSQFNMIDRGESLGDSMGMFRAMFFREEQEHFGSKWVLNMKMADELATRLSHSSIRYSEAEVQDLPPILGGMRGGYMIRSCALPPQNLKYYERVVKQLKDEGDESRRKVGYMQQRMISSGWIGSGADEERIELVFTKNPKMDLLEELVMQEIPADARIVIFTHFKVSNDLVMERLKKLKQDVVQVTGATTTQQKIKRMAQAESHEGPRILCATSAIKMGINIQDYFQFMIFFESSDDAETRYQQECRIDREGDSKWTRHIYDLVTDGTEDEKILIENIKGKRSMNRVLDGVTSRKRHVAS